MRFRGSHTAAAAAVFASLALPSTAAADWPFYGHDLANTRNAGAAGPSPGQLGSIARAWTFTTQTGDFTGTPVVADGVVVAGNNGGWVYALDAVTGKVLWSKDLGAPVNGTAAIDTAAPGGAMAYVPVAKPGTPHLVALSLADGTTRWQTVLTSQPNASVYGSPVFWKRSIYIGTSGPNNDDSTARGSLVALDEATGRIRWQTFTAPPGRDGVAVFSTPAIDTATGRLYVGTGNNYHPPTTDLEDSVLAVDTADGRVLAHYQATQDDSFSAVDNPTGPDADFGASANLFDGPNGQKLVGEGQKSGTYWALDRASMQPVWNTTVGPSGPLGGILGSTAVDDTRIYGADTADGQVFALGLDGALQWESVDSGALHVSAATVAHGVLYTLDPAGALNARDPASGSILARLQLDGPALGGVSAVGGALFVAVGTGPLPEPAPQTENTGSIVAFGDTSGAARPTRPAGGKLRLTVSPRRVKANRLVRLRFRATLAGQPVARVKIRVGRRRVFTKSDGRAAVRLRFHHAGVRAIHAGRRGLGGTRGTVRVKRR